MSADTLSDEPHPDEVVHSTFQDWVVKLENDREFERVVEDFYDRLDWETELTQKTRDGGYDVRLERPGRSKLVEVKHSLDIGPAVIRKIAGTALAENVSGVSVIAISFTSGATKTATRIQENSHLEVELLDTHELYTTFRKIDMWDMLDDYSAEREPVGDGVFDY